MVDQEGSDYRKKKGKKYRSVSAAGVKLEVAEEDIKEIRNRYSVNSWVKSTPSSLVNHRLPIPSQFVSQMPPALIRKIPTATSFTKNVHKAKILIWSDLTLSHIERLNEIQNYDQIKRLLADIFSLGNYKQNLKSNIVLDLFYYTLQFARKEHFSPEQTSVFFSIIKRILEVCQETPYGNLDYTYQYFKELLFCHCVNRPPMSVEIFTKEQAVNICTYTLNTFFRHFKLYKYVFTPTIRLDLTLKYIGTSPVTPVEAETSEFDGNDEEEDTNSWEEAEHEEIDYEKIQAQEDLKRIVTDFLLKEAKKIEGSVDNHLKVAMDSLNAKLDPLIDITPAKNVKGKKR